MAAAIQAIPNVMRDLIRILNKFSIKICLTGLPRRHKCLLAMTIPVAMQQRPSFEGMTPRAFEVSTQNTSSQYRICKFLHPSDSDIIHSFI
ncbi:hypothetical protein [Rickettsia endosymbiont of Ceutorhynchus obstrictus]|uniref:hypothetical protein n=1 Tax=Rickettsia endosymbiont of Ceutorhynchus obstrictus TaxID=3066249 RepID=UPI003132EA6F